MQSRTHPNSTFPARRCQAAPLADLEGSKGLVCCTLWCLHTPQFLASLRWFDFSEQDTCLSPSFRPYLFVCGRPSLWGHEVVRTQGRDLLQRCLSLWGLAQVLRKRNGTNRFERPDLLWLRPGGVWGSLFKLRACMIYIHLILPDGAWRAGAGAGRPGELGHRCLRMEELGQTSSSLMVPRSSGS